MKNFRRLVCFAIITVVTLALFSVASFASGGEKKKLYVYNWGQYIGDGTDDTIDVVAEFEKKYPNIDVIYTTYDTNESLYAKLKSGGANYDIVIPSDYMVEKLIEEDMLAKIDTSNMPNYKNINSVFTDGNYYDPTNEYSVPYTYGTVGLIYNTEYVTKTVDSWNILWDEDYKGKILMFDNPRDSFAIAEFILGIDVNTTKTDDYDKCAELLKKQTKILKGHVMDQVFDQMINGDAWVTPYYAGDFLTMYSENDSLAFAYPKEGYNYFVDAMCILKNTQNKEAAELFIDFMCDPEIAGQNSEAIGYATPVDGAEEYMSEEFASLITQYINVDVARNGSTFKGLDNDSVNYMTKLWSQVKAGTTNIWLIIGICAAVVAVIVILIVASAIVKKKKKNLYEEK